MPKFSYVSVESDGHVLPDEGPGSVVSGGGSSLPPHAAMRTPARRSPARPTDKNSSIVFIISCTRKGCGAIKRERPRASTTARGDARGRGSRHRKKRVGRWGRGPTDKQNCGPGPHRQTNCGPGPHRQNKTAARGPTDKQNCGPTDDRNAARETHVISSRVDRVGRSC